MKRNKCTIMEEKIIERYIVFDYLFMKGTFFFSVELEESYSISRY